MCGITSQTTDDHEKALKFAKNSIKYIHQVVNDT